MRPNPEPKQSPFDTILDIGSGLDWISPTIAFIQDWLNGPHCDFGIAPGPYSANDVKRFLQEKGVKAWGLMLAPNRSVIMFTVKKSQAKWAYYLLQQNGFPVLYVPKEAVEEKSPTDIKQQKARNQPSKLETQINNFFKEIFD